MLADISLGDLLWSLLVFYLIVQCLFIVGVVLVDLFRSDDLSGARKALWVVGVLLVPIIAVIVYLVSRGDGIGARNLRRDQPLPPPPASAPLAPASELQLAKRLLDEGTVTTAEYETMKARILG